MQSNERRRKGVKQFSFRLAFFEKSAQTTVGLSATGQCEFKKLCAASSDSSEKNQPHPSCWRVCGGWNTAAMTARESPYCRRPICSSAKKSEGLIAGLRRF